MSKKTTRAYSRYALEALSLMAQHIKLTRIERKIKAQDLSERAGISRGLLKRIENADPSCSIGVVFEVASILGIPLFHADYETLIAQSKDIKEKLSLLPSKVRHKKIEVDDDF